MGERFQSLTSYLSGGEETVIITDHNVRAIYGHEFPSCPVIEMGTGEGAKTLDTVRKIYERLMDLEADRSWFVLGIGGCPLSQVCPVHVDSKLRESASAREVLEVAAPGILLNGEAR